MAENGQPYLKEPALARENAVALLFGLKKRIRFIGENLPTYLPSLTPRRTSPDTSRSADIRLAVSEVYRPVHGLHVGSLPTRHELFLRTEALKRAIKFSSLSLYSYIILISNWESPMRPPKLVGRAVGVDVLGSFYGWFYAWLSCMVGYMVGSALLYGSSNRMIPGNPRNFEKFRTRRTRKDAFYWSFQRV